MHSSCSRLNSFHSATAPCSTVNLLFRHVLPHSEAPWFSAVVLCYKLNSVRTVYLSFQSEYQIQKIETLYIVSALHHSINVADWTWKIYEPWSIHSWTAAWSRYWTPKTDSEPLLIHIAKYKRSFWTLSQPWILPFRRLNIDPWSSHTHSSARYRRLNLLPPAV